MHLKGRTGPKVGDRIEGTRRTVVYRQLVA